ncbi:MAG TPA: alpha/beta fold hydrolase [Actinomycetes bacterium]|jgi:pimeloyl-ACP methyl ester carboxylesterase|nr:alpha/beta fold hydrolase [Actinomycetes bacterium]
MDGGLPAFTYRMSLHGDDVHYVRAGDGPVLVLIHGILGSRRSWEHLVSLLMRDFTVIAPDLLGHGDSAKPRGDYSLGAHAGRLRDLLDELGVERVTLVGHSLGGGVALEFAWLFPQRCERLVLVSSGGLGRYVNPILRAPTLPGVEWLLPLVSRPWLLRTGEQLARRLGRVGVRSGPDIEELWRGYISLGDAGSRRAFLATIRTVVDPGGQTVSALERLPLLAHIPTLLVWGARDRLIPVAQGRAAQQAILGSRLEVFERAGHAPHLSDPARFVALLRDFVASAPTPQTDHSGERGRRRASRPAAGGDQPAAAS